MQKKKKVHRWGNETIKGILIPIIQGILANCSTSNRNITLEQKSEGWKQLKMTFEYKYQSYQYFLYRMGFLSTKDTGGFFLFLLENSIQKIFRSVDVEISLDFSS